MSVPRLIIANDFDDNVWLRGDSRAWSHRALWLAEPGDVVVLPDEPDPEFVQHVARARSVDVDTYQIVSAPGGARDRQVVDSNALLGGVFGAELAALLSGRSWRVELLWPSAQILRFVRRLDADLVYPGAEFFSQGGGNFVNSKAVFRCVAAGLGVRILEGGVAFDPSESVQLSSELLVKFDCVVVKKSHAGAGAGNRLLAFEEKDRSGVGIRTAWVLDSNSPEALEKFWASTWEWASYGNRYPVVVERFAAVDSSVYVEFEFEEWGAEVSGYGTLEYAQSIIQAEFVDKWPVGLSPLVSARILAESVKLAGAFWGMGYRGTGCFDAVVENGEIFFTEFNARSTSGTHLHRSIKSLGANARVVQHLTPLDTPYHTTDAILRVLRELDLEFNEVKGNGIVLCMPASPDSHASGFLFASIGLTDNDVQRFFSRLQP